MTTTTEPALFRPITLRSTTFRNRLWVPSLTMFASEGRDGVPSPFHFVHLGGIAAGGAGAIITESTAVTPEGRVSPHDVGIWSDELRDAWIPIVEFAHSQGTMIGVQLGHGGRKSATNRSWEPQVGTIAPGEGGWLTVGPSAIAYEGYDVPRALTLDEVHATVAAFVDAARRSLEAGFDFVEIHAAHGFLIHQFLSPLSNRRRDEYGGSFENRARFFLEIVEGIRVATDDDFPIVVRVSATDWVEGGWDEEQTAAVARLAAAAGADFFDVSTGGLVPDAKIPVFPGYQVQFAERLREAAGVPTGAVGLILTAHQADDIVAAGRADVVFVGREFMRDPHFGLRAAAELGLRLDYHPLPYHRARFAHTLEG
ncbi:oxidoreductase [Frondihabitans sp. PAMC 28766]|uniref:NADH:flavin oxidoreductase/NADH oxidase n=1 Tax=Frondihabitans sp. PAMC 28766 TaxID=1795630 RepID=UPI00078E442F|nr:NADH:flavin oxidoreductase/NADH oxidase [Frondihabitans sp. PAMC 28766]AMM21912.1 oxidoreductase [Frondihabitans sp. PAMC 28766]